ncbi:thioredoxin family protein [Flavivirga eckloniae]|uniref:Thioredoxin domain-containing protein n=1 Tax=Flavivirga eckloniae TaxID=1803846 RepID=A0A2K9PT40_9FLAO|nr:thioredoxin family protein [Flavivirga eckloniae]AUP79978.1 hypothetical protein C1H87_15215 [Flavivirga eckloniae]
MKKININILILFLLTSICSCAQEKATGIHFFKGSFEEAKTLAKAENKKIFVDVYTTWCAPCKKMTKEVFPDKALGAYYNAHFISIKIDAEKGEGIKIAKDYNVGGYPTLIYVDSEGKTINKMTSYLGIEEMQRIGESVLQGDSNFEELELKYNQKSISQEELFHYMTALKGKGLYDRAEKAFEQYFLAEVKSGVTLDMFEQIFQYIRSSEDVPFQYLIENKEKFYQFKNKEKVDEIIRNYYLDEFMYAKIPETEADYFAAKKELAKKVEIDDFLSVNLDNNYYYKKQNEDKYMETAKVLFDRHSKEEDQLKISYIVGGAVKFKNPDHIKTLLTWAKRALEIDDNSINIASVSVYYAKLNDRAKAQEYYDKAIAKSLSDKDNYHESIKLGMDEYLSNIKD